MAHTDSGAAAVGNSRRDTADAANVSLPAALQMAIEHHRDGRLADAAAIYLGSRLADRWCAGLPAAHFEVMPLPPQAAGG